MQVVDMDDILDRVVAEVVGFAISETGPDPAAGEPHRKSLHVVIAADLVSFTFLGHRRAAEFATPNDKRLFEHSSLLEIGYERGGGAVARTGTNVDEVFQVVVMIPVAVIKLNESNAAFCHPPRQNAVARK